MGRVFFAMGMSLDGYVEDASGSFDFAVPGYWPSAAAAPEELSEVAAEFARAYSVVVREQRRRDARAATRLVLSELRINTGAPPTTG